MPAALTAWCVSLTWGGGTQTISLTLAPDIGGAAAAAALAAARSGNIGDDDLTGVMVVPLPVEWMRQTLRTIEGGGPALGLVVPMSVPGRAAGGKARAAALSPERRSEIAKKAAETRWHGDEPPDGAA